MIKISFRDIKADLPPALLKKKLEEKKNIDQWREINTQEEFNKLPASYPENPSAGIYSGPQFYLDSNGSLVYWDTTVGFQYHPSGKESKDNQHLYFYSDKFKCLLMVHPDLLQKYSKERIFRRLNEILENKKDKEHQAYKL